MAEVNVTLPAGMGSFEIAYARGARKLPDGKGPGR